MMRMVSGAGSGGICRAGRNRKSFCPMRLPEWLSKIDFGVYLYRSGKRILNIEMENGVSRDEGKDTDLKEFYVI